MTPLTEKERRILEVALILVCLGLAALLHVMQGYKIVILNLFFLPVVLLMGFELGLDMIRSSQLAVA